ncbi:WD40 repeat domain-containing protein [Sulfurimonas sp.]|uniref:WD40 repeat domain-containing protein n=1 Tax=Sulfurimonas sp. TaxID=2022749 RepID=UPI0035639285
MNPTKKQNYSKSIILSKVLDNDIIVIVDSDSTIMLLNKQTLEPLKSFEIGIKHQSFKTSVVAISHDAKHFATLSSDARESLLYETKTKNVITTVDRHHGEVSCVAIDPKAKYMFSCGDDGKTYVIEIATLKLAFLLPVHKDIVYDIAFSDDGRWVATASHDKTISLFYLPNKIPKHYMFAHSEPVKKLCFLSEHRLFSIDKSNSAIIWDMYEATVITRLEGIHEDVTCVTKSSESKFLFLGTDLGYILVYELENYKLLSSSYIKLKSSITTLEFYEKNEQLMVGTKSGELHFYDIYHGQNNLKILYKEKDFLGMEKFIEINPILEYSKVYQAIDLVWQQTLQKAKEYIENGDKKSAMKLLNIYTSVPSKHKIIQELFDEFEKFEKLNAFIRDGKIALAYSLVHSDEIYLDSKAYKVLENDWQKVLALAKKHAYEANGGAKITKLFEPYRGVSEKTQDIQDVILHNKVYIKFIDSIAKKDYKLASALLKKYEFLEEVPEHEELVYYSDSLYIDSQKLIEEGNFNEALKLLHILEDFSEFEEIARKSILDIQKSTQ